MHFNVYYNLCRDHILLINGICDVRFSFIAWGRKFLFLSREKKHVFFPEKFNICGVDVMPFWKSCPIGDEMAVTQVHKLVDSWTIDYSKFDFENEKSSPNLRRSWDD